MKLDKKSAPIVIFAATILIIAGIYLYSSLREEKQPAGSSSAKEEIAYKSEVLQEGRGAISVKPGDKIIVNYIGTLEDRTIFESNLSTGEPFETFIGKGTAPVGLDEGLLGMKVGEKRKITVPVAYAGSGTRGNAPENSVLYFEVELLEIR